jgi:hypothetical protein
VGISKTKQAIMKVKDDRFLIILFSSSGDLIEIKEIDIPEAMLSLRHQKQYDLQKMHDLIEEEVNLWRNRFDLKDGRIYVKRFWISDKGIGIDDWPFSIQEYIMEPEKFTPEEKEELEEELQGWKEEGDLYVFSWDNEFYVDGNGRIVSS